MNKGSPAVAFLQQNTKLLILKEKEPRRLRAAYSGKTRVNKGSNCPGCKKRTRDTETRILVLEPHE